MELGTITIADWSRQTLPFTFGPSDDVSLVSLEAVGDALYVSGTFTTINGVPRPFLAAVHPDTGVVLPFAASPDSGAHVRQWGNRLVASGAFRRIGGKRRRGLAELDPATGRALDWNPDAPGSVGMEVGGDGHLYVVPSQSLSGRDLRFSLVAISPVTLRPLPWRPPLAFLLSFDSLSFLPDCLFVHGSRVDCYPRATPSPRLPAVQQDGDRVTFQWHLPPGPPIWTAVRVEVGRREGASDVAAFNLPADATSITQDGPAGHLVRARAHNRPAQHQPLHGGCVVCGGPAGRAGATARCDGGHGGHRADLRVAAAVHGRAASVCARSRDGRGAERRGPDASRRWRHPLHARCTTRTLLGAHTAP